MEPLISIIVPVYMVEEYIEECVDSLINQTYKKIEILLVDDGSKDNSGTICDRYAQSDERIVVYHKPNSGLSDTRNFGVGKAHGEYVFFVDSDDYLSTDAIQKCVRLLDTYQAEIVVAGLTPVVQGVIRKKTNYESTVLSTEEALRRMCYFQGFGVSACAKLYSIELVRKHPYPVGVLHEDLDTTYRMIGDCRRIAFCGENIYFYNQRPESITHRQLSQERLYAFTAANHQLEYIKRNYPSAVAAAHCRVARVVYEFLPLIVKKQPSAEEKKFFNVLRDELKKHYWYTVFSPETKAVFKFIYTSILFGYGTAYHAVMLIRKIKE